MYIVKYFSFFFFLFIYKRNNRHNLPEADDRFTGVFRVCASHQSPVGYSSNNNNNTNVCISI